MGLIFAEFATSLKSLKIDTAKNKPCYTSLKDLEIAKIGLSENLTHLPSAIFAKISRLEKIPDIRYTVFNFVYAIKNKQSRDHSTYIFKFFKFWIHSNIVLNRNDSNSPYVILAMLFGLRISIQYPSGSLINASPFILPVRNIACSSNQWYHVYCVIKFFKSSLKASRVR